MKSKNMEKELTFGDLIAKFYHAFGKRRGQGFLRLALKVHFVEFRGDIRYVLTRGNGKA
jgi:hypothetical protein